MNKPRLVSALSFACAVVLNAFAIEPQGQPATSQATSHADSWPFHTGGLAGHPKVMTYNVYQGTDFVEVLKASDETQFLIAVGQTLSQVRATQPHERMKAIARQIAQGSPDLVSVQELAQWSSGSFDTATRSCGTMTIEFDMAEDLLDALAERGARYTVAVAAPQFTIPPTPGLMPSGEFFCAQLINQVALLARDDGKASQFSLSNPQAGTYQHVLTVATPYGIVPLPRGWGAVDVAWHKRKFRFIGTHLESADPAIRREQATELRAGPAMTPLPTVIAMDSNIDAAALPPDLTYLDFIAENFHDVWSAVHPELSGYTCCQAQLLNNSLSQLSQRFDLILTRGPIRVKEVAVRGADAESKTAAGLWPSDHAAVEARLVLHASGRNCGFRCEDDSSSLDND
jgi:endonuclease/exonuclease/phosphatase family metal-dependent hydrolase